MIPAADTRPAVPLRPLVLIVDDEASVTDSYARLLRLEGFTVATAVNPRVGLELASRRRPDAIILDMRMPLISGIQFLREVRAQPHLVEVPVTIVTGDYFLPEPLKLEVERLDALVRFKPVWHQDLLKLARKMTNAEYRFLRACRRETVDATPVWFMRQAGRYMSDYRELRKRYSLLEICREPELSVAVTLQPLDVIEVDAAILFSDLLLPFTPLGLAFDFVKGEGPSIERPIRSTADVERLRQFEPREALGHVLETIRILRKELDYRLPLIGFGGAPFTLAAYAIEGGPSTTYQHTKAFMYSEPAAWHRLCERLSGMMADYLVAQVEAGAQALQIFDSWAGALGRSDYREFAFPHTAAIFERLRGLGVPLIHFGVGTTAILTDMAEAGGDVMGLDWRQPLDEAWARVPDRGVQGNLDPTLLLGAEDRLFAATDDVLRRAGGRSGHIFNLGHGVLPSTPLERVQELARHVHRKTRVQDPVE